ncbi:hypothetical protein BDV96DRAFT_654214 [Lophiotrema nucula]|uniref:Uncharacterized protein n=1 Tax=Lophiotrema nucula TaxID=690887 RepID=A0A6A5YI00_9PLEO|nr:hypothetical protein BDV96DRAFT_654214 [Lophiotrema nucula]
MAAVTENEIPAITREARADTVRTSIDAAATNDASTLQPSTRDSQPQRSTPTRGSLEETPARTEVARGKTITSTDVRAPRFSPGSASKVTPSKPSKLVTLSRVLYPQAESTPLSADIIVVYLYNGRRSEATDADLAIFEANRVQTSKAGPQKSETESASVPKQALERARRLSATAPQPGSKDEDRSATIGTRLTKSGETPKTTPASKPTKINWLKDSDYLPKVLPEARVVTIGIDIRNVMDSQFDLEAAATALAKAIALERTKESDRPVLFIGHTLGGFVIQQLLVRAARGDDSGLVPLLKSTAGLLLFNCPASGCDEKRKELFGRFYGLRSSSMFFSELEPDSRQLQSLRENFNTSVLMLEDGSSSDALPTSNLRPDAGSAAVTSRQLIRRTGFPVYRFRSKEFFDKSEKALFDGSEAARKLPSRRTRRIEGAKNVIPVPKNLLNITRFTKPRAEDPDFIIISDIIEDLVQSRRLLDTAAKGTTIEMSSLLYTQGLYWRLTDIRGRTALHIAVQRTNRPVVQWLLETAFKDDPSIADGEADTPLHYAVRRNDVEMVEGLLAAGADVNAENRYYETPITLATRSIKINKALREVLRGKRLKLTEGQTFGIRDIGDNKPQKPRSGDAEIACRNFQITVTEVFKLGDARGADHHWRLSLSVEEGIYDANKVEDIIGQLRPIEVTDRKPLCRWIHIPQNNTTWVEDLFAKLGYCGSIFAGSGYADSPSRKRGITPHVALPSKWDDPNRGVLAIFMPYVSYDVKEHQEQVDHFLEEIDAGKRRTTPSDDIQSIRSTLSESTETTKGNKSVSWGRALSGDSSTPSPRQVAHRWLSAIGKANDSDTVDDDGGFTFITAKSSAVVSTMPEGGGLYSIDDDDKALMRAYTMQSATLHTRRTLDQYYYHMLSSTALRDEDQVVTRWANRDLPHGDQNVPHNILMVDQLWLWQFKDKEDVEYVISSFPDRAGVDTAYDDNLRQVVLEPRDGRRPISSSADLAFRIFGACSNVFDRGKNEELLRFIDAFEGSIGRVSDKESSLFKRFQMRSRKLHRLRPGFKQYVDMRRLLLDRLLDIRKETELLVEIKDILDEINIILSVLQIQEKLLNDDKLDEFKRGRQHPSLHYEDARRIVSNNLIDFERMRSQAQDVQVSLNTLMDLKQKAANAWEARASRENAEATAKQGMTMLVFTAVTIIFLPLSFMTSFFAIEISKFPQDPVTGETSWPLGRVCAYIFGISAAIIAPMLWLAFRLQWLSVYLKHVHKHSTPTFILYILKLLYKIRIAWLRNFTRARFETVKGQRDGYSHRKYEHAGLEELTDESDDEKEERSRPPHLDLSEPESGTDSSSCEGISDLDSDDFFEETKRSTFREILRRRRTNDDLDETVKIRNSEV